MKVQEIKTAVENKEKVLFILDTEKSKYTIYSEWGLMRIYCRPQKHTGGHSRDTIYTDMSKFLKAIKSIKYKK
tara:strand:+ start:7514 stop:7732 length:219 start_codon:yes stop_codon:yes gene_type:complete